jgi:hypothetical protein
MKPRPMYAKHGEVENCPDRQREQQMEPHLGALHYESASSSLPLGQDASTICLTAGSLMVLS